MVYQDQQTHSFQFQMDFGPSIPLKYRVSLVFPLIGGAGVASFGPSYSVLTAQNLFDQTTTNNLNLVKGNNLNLVRKHKNNPKQKPHALSLKSHNQRNKLNLVNFLIIIQSLKLFNELDEVT